MCGSCRRQLSLFEEAADRGLDVEEVDEIVGSDDVLNQGSDEYLLDWEPKPYR